MDNEKWLPCVGFENICECSSLGRIKTLDRWVKARSGGKRFNPGKILKGHHNSCGYPSVRLDGKKQYTVHRLVAATFLSNPDNKPAINHKNGIRHDNRIENLEWVTFSENSLHAYDNKLTSMLGESHPLSKLSEKQVLEIYNSSLSCIKLAKIYNVRKQSILGIKNGKHWRRVTGASNNLNKKNAKN